MSNDGWHLYRTRAAFEALEESLAQLTRAGALKTPYQSYAWLYAWLHHRAPELEPYVLVSADGDTIAPLCRLRRAGVRVLRLLGTGDSDYCGIVSRLSEKDAWDGVARALAARRGDWDLVHLHSIEDVDGPRAAFENRLGERSHRRVYDHCPWIRTDRDYASLLAGRHGNHRRSIRRWARHMDSLGGARVEVHPTPFDDTLLGQLEEIERASWKWGSGDAALRPGPQRDFLEAYLRHPGAGARLWLMHVGGRAVASAVVLVAGAGWYYYLTSFRQDCAHAGAYLLDRIVEAACEAPDCESLDLLRGPHAYKLAWTDRSCPVHELVAGSGLRGGAGRAFYRLRWMAARSRRLQRLRSGLLRVGDRRS